MSEVIIKVENLSKQYRLGQVGTGTISHDLNRWWHKIRGKDDPYLKIGQGNNRSIKSESEYIWALQSVDFEVQQGEVLGIIGKNGAGKSTLLKILSKVTGPTTGTIKAKGRIASLLEVGTGFHPEMTGRENIFMNGTIMGMNRHEIASKLDEIVDFAGVANYLDTPVKRYSSGMTVRLGFAIAAHLEPEILIVDEVLAVGDASFQKKAVGKMKDVSTNSGRTVLFVSHNMGAIENLCTRALLMTDGKVSFGDSVSNTITKYLSINENMLANSLAENIKNRTGNQHAIFAGFHLENVKEQQVQNALAGEDIIFVFTLKRSQDLFNLDIGFSIHNHFDECLSVLYSSYQNRTFQTVGTSNYVQIKCMFKEINWAPGRYFIKGRIQDNGHEIDWPKENIGVVDVEMGDFYNTGNLGFEGKTTFLLKGEWMQKS